VLSARIRFGLEAQSAVQRGFDTIARIAQATLGPTGRVVAVEAAANRNRSPELLDDAATIARRVVAIPDPFENMGARLARHLAWHVREEVGDGSATALVLAQAVIADSIRHIAAGHNAMDLWRGIQKTAPYLLARLDEMAMPLESPEQIQTLATAMVGDEELGHFIEEIFDIVGPEGHIEVREAYGRQNDREYVEGVYWDSGWISPYFADKDKSLQASVQRPYILLTDYSLSNAPDLLPTLEAVRRAEGKGLVIIANDVTGAALNLLVTNNARGTLRILCLKAPRYGDLRSAILDDIALSTGARVIRKDAGDSIAQVTLRDLGRAQHVVCNRATFTLMGTMGSPQGIRDRVQTLRAARQHVHDERERENLDERIGKLLGGSALLHVSGQTDAERKHAKQIAENAVRVVRHGLHGGIVPGGGSAYVACLPALDEVELPETEAPALNILRHALMAPMACVTRNAGHDPGPIIAWVQDAPPGSGFDALRGERVDMLAANVVDPLPTVRTALTLALSIATMAITTDALIHRTGKESMADLEP
jgi:chaperonin GroEL